ncbi:MAG: pyridoxal phosphate-dependent aminotransferase [Bacteroidales bacterium]|nr:pyridoxal phosphate-dependent aminotransferase [Bacteroidales bacterium]
MNYNFDEKIERRGSDCVKYDLLKALYGDDDLLPMWVADMDFRSPDFVMEALRKRCSHEVLGYAIPSEGYNIAVTSWLREHYNIHANRDELHFIPGIVAGISYALLCLTQPGDKILVTTPVYPPFLNLPTAAGRETVCSKLKIEKGRFSIDFDDFERKAKECKIFLMSNPHNPAGTIWGKEVLSRVAEICEREGLLVISDEIHADMVLGGRTHVSYSTVNDIAFNHSITFMAPSKTFNIAGLGSSTCYIGNRELRKRFFGWLEGLGVAGGNIFAFTGAEAAFSHGEEWRRQMVKYLDGNVETLRDFISEKMPLVKVVLPEASYLAWLDMGKYGISHAELSRIIVEKARLALNDGTTFGGKDYECCFRINIGCPRATLVEGLSRLCQALQARL